MKIYQSRYGYSKHDSNEYKGLIGKVIRCINSRSSSFEDFDNIEISSSFYIHTNKIKYFAEVTDTVIYVSVTKDVKTLFADIDIIKMMPVKLGLKVSRGD